MDGRVEPQDSMTDGVAPRPRGRAFDFDKVQRGVRLLLEGIGEDLARDGMRDTPTRVARMYEEITTGLREDSSEVLQVVFEEGHDEMVMVRDIPMYSICVASSQLVDAVGGQKRARDVQVGDQLWTLHEGRVQATRVTAIQSRMTKELVEVRTGKGAVQVTPDHPFATPHGWIEAKDLEGTVVEWTPPRSLSRPRLRPLLGYDFGCAVGAICADGTVAERYISLFDDQSSAAIGARFTPGRDSRASSLYVADSWYGRHGFKRESHRTDLIESRWVRVEGVRRIHARRKPFTVYSFTCDPDPTFLISGHLTHNCEHHLLPFIGRAHVAYIPNRQGQITGLSKLARLVDGLAKRPQVQERLTSQVADALVEGLDPQGALVVIEAEHLCMSMRGVRKPGAITVTSAVRGVFRASMPTRLEAMNLIGVSRRGE